MKKNRKKKKSSKIIADDLEFNYGWKPIHNNPMWKYIFLLIIGFCLVIPLAEILSDFFECGLYKC